MKKGFLKSWVDFFLFFNRQVFSLGSEFFDNGVGGEGQRWMKRLVEIYRGEETLIET